MPTKTQFPAVTILICTYNRPDEIRATMEALIDNLAYPNVRVLISDDSTPGRYLSSLKRLKAFKHWPTTFVSTEQNAGWGANVNNGLKHVDTDYVFFLEDDYVLTTPLDLRVGVALMEAKADLLGMVRYRATAGEHMVLHQFEADITGLIPDFHEHHAYVPGRVTYLQLDSGSPSLWLYSHGPHLKHKRFHVFYGAYPEGLKLGQTEESYAHRVKDGMKTHGAPGIAILPGWVTMRWQHIGTSYQGTEADT